jgi:hypothetical protein
MVVVGEYVKFIGMETAWPSLEFMMHNGKRFHSKALRMVIEGIGELSLKRTEDDERTMVVKNYERLDSNNTSLLGNYNLLSTAEKL